MKKLINGIYCLADAMLVLLVIPSAWLMKSIRRAGVRRLPLCKSAMITVGVFPVRSHFYEPQFDHRNPKPEFSEDRKLPGIDWNVSGQLAALDGFIYSHELKDIPKHKPESNTFYLLNGEFESGDAEYWYQLIRATKPRRIYEIGSGNSSLLAVKAIVMNRSEDSNYDCEHICVEPFAKPWLEKADVSLVKKKVEDLELSFFDSLEENDILFIDSSHIIRPQGDVLYEYLQLLPSLKKGVIVHVHDIFSPKNYLSKWLKDEVRFWNEQYLLEAFLSDNSKWQIIGAVNYLHHHHYERLKLIAPFLSPEQEPGSFYIKKIA